MSDEKSILNEVCDLMDQHLRPEAKKVVRLAKPIILAEAEKGGTRVQVDMPKAGQSDENVMAFLRCVVNEGLSGFELDPIPDRPANWSHYPRLTISWKNRDRPDPRDHEIKKLKAEREAVLSFFGLSNEPSSGFMKIP